ncbi:hypothetical protein MMC19_007253 [Ptychographa xylographoides]|nr:hypothetical protein [Ptychographa xylographoides]
MDAAIGNPDPKAGPPYQVEIHRDSEPPPSPGSHLPLPTPTAEIAVDDEWDFSDYNSDATSFVSRISSSITDYQWENGRRYHAYQEGRYPLPNDESELDREDMKHHEMMLITEFRLHMAPIPENAEKILDLGTGTGIWAIQMGTTLRLLFPEQFCPAENHPTTEVIGVDLSPVQPEWVPPNLTFEIDDIEAPWLYTPASFDFIHARFLFLAVKDFPALLEQAYRTLKPGGYIELTELDIHPESYDNRMPENSQIKYWISLLDQASQRMGLDFFIARKFKGLLEDAGFVDVTEEIFEVPWGGWPKDTRLKTIGVWHLEQLLMGLQGIAMGLFTRQFGWTAEQVEVFLVGLRRELKDKHIHVIDHVYLVHGRKPL